MIYIPWTFLEIAIQGHLLWGFSCSCIKMPRKRSQMGLQISDCLVLVVSICSLFWCTLPKQWLKTTRVISRLHGWGSGRGWAGCQVWDGAAVSPAGSAGGGSICFLLGCVAAGRPQFLTGCWTEGLSFSCGPLHRDLPTGQLPSSEWSSEKSQRRGRGREGGERGVGGGES